MSLTRSRTPPRCTRRRFLYGAGALAAGAALPTQLLFGSTGNATAAQAPRLVVVILRGALDGLAAVPPYADPRYADLRQELAIAPPGAPDGALLLDPVFGLHPSLKFLHERYLARETLVFHAVASPYRDRSHFDGQNVLESGLLRPLGSADGWLNRALPPAPPRGMRGAPAVERAVAVSQNVPLILRGPAPVLSKSPLTTPDVNADLVARLQDLYSKDDWFSARWSEAVQGEAAGRLGEDAGPAAMAGQPATGGRSSAGAAKNADRMGAATQMAATLLRAEDGPEIAVLDAVGWDTHANQGGATGTLAQRLSSLDNALRLLAHELGPAWSRTAVLVVTEFGRTAAVNGTRGTDHGTGGCAFLTGGAVSGGRVISDWPGLGPGDLLDARDLKPTLDLRSVFKGVLAEHLRIAAGTLSARVFPDSRSARPLQGLMRALPV